VLFNESVCLFSVAQILYNHLIPLRVYDMFQSTLRLKVCQYKVLYKEDNYHVCLQMLSCMIVGIKVHGTVQFI
jgi:hypothetical protein